MSKLPDEPLTMALAQIPIAAVKTFLCRDVMSTLTEFEPTATHSPTLQIVAQGWNYLPEQSAVVQDILTVLAKASAAMLPAWYRQENIFSVAENNHPLGIGTLLQCQTLQTIQPAICEPWLKAALRAWELGQLPLPRQFSNALHLAQLALTIGVDRLVLILAINDPQPEKFRLLGFAKAATWIAQETGARVATLIPPDLADCEELASILYGAVSIDLPAPSAIVIPEKAEHCIAPNQRDTPPGQAAASISQRAKNEPGIQGKPHASSPGEQQLADRLSRDRELAPLFWFNQRVGTVRGTSYLVDLLWSNGRVIVEVDGYQHHSDLPAFCQDRNRDYELLISGYVVLRLPHDEVIADIEIAIEKIRDVVRFRRNQKLDQGEV